MRIVIDTHVIFSGALFGASYTGQIMTAWLSERRIDVALSTPILTELRRVSDYPYVTARYHWTAKQQEVFLRVLCRKAVLIEHVPQCLSVAMRKIICGLLAPVLLKPAIL